MRYALPSGHEKRLVVAMIETARAIDDLEAMLEVDGVDVFFIGPGDLSQDMGYPPAPSFGEPRPAPVIAKVGEAVAKIRRDGRVAGTLVTLDEMPYWLEQGVQYFYVHSDPFLRLGMDQVKGILQGAQVAAE